MVPGGLTNPMSTSPKATAAVYVSHLSCSRSTPWLRRNLTTSAAGAMSISAGKMLNADAASSIRSPRGPCSANGLGIDRGRSPACGPTNGGATTIGWSASADPTAAATTNAAKAHSRMANARPGGRPSGKRTSAETTEPSTAVQMNDPDHSASSPPGNAAPASRLACPYASARAPSWKNAPAAPRSQPIGPPARRMTRSDPTSANDSRGAATTMNGPK